MYLPHKNHKTVIDVIKLLKDKYFVELNAVFTGSDVGYKKNLLAYSKKQKIENFTYIFYNIFSISWGCQCQ